MDDMDRLFVGAGMGQPLSSGLESSMGPSLMGQIWSPQVEVFERNGQLTIRADLPGLNKDDVHVRVADDMLTIEGERRHEQQENREGFYHSERSYGSFQRSIRLPQGVDADAIKASFDRGVLEITMPKPEPKARGRRIDVQSGASTQTSGPQVEARKGAQTGASGAVQSTNGPTSQQSPQNARLASRPRVVPGEAAGRAAQAPRPRG